MKKSTMTIQPLRLLLSLALICSPIAAHSAQQQATYQIAQRRIAAKPPTLTVKQGDTLLIHFSTDETASIHLHGYNVLLGLVPGARGTMRIVASAPGRFPVSAHGFGAAAGKHGKHQREVPLLYVEVQPQ